MKKDAVLRLRIPSDLLEKIDGAAAKQRRERSDWVRIVLEDAINAESPDQKETQKKSKPRGKKLAS